MKTLELEDEQTGKRLLVSLSSYGNYSSGNYGAHCMQVQVGSLDLVFSYQTVVAFNAHDGEGDVVCENCWGQTTGKHLNWIDGGDKGSQLPRPEFLRRLEAMLEKHGLDVKGGR